jgi:ribonuclease E
MLINATQPEELRVAIVDGQKLYNLDIESPGREQKKANIYKGTITRVEPSLEAAFVDYGSERHGFLPLKEISRAYFSQELKPGTKANIKDLIKEGREVVVQIDKEERGNKGAALTTFISLAGRYLVLMPNNPRAGGVSRRIDGADRSELREVLSQLEIPEDMGLIVRTAGVGKNTEELQWDLDYLLQLWDAIKTSGENGRAPFLIYQESDIIIRSIRDHLRADIGEIVVDSAEMYRRAEEFIQQVMPHNQKKLRLYQDEVPLFTRYQIESQIESAFQRDVRLPSGGALVIDHTEALTSIDINSARATKGADIEETALNTNLEAADEIARQLRLRDLGGLFVIDFIDMTPAKHQREVENRLREALKQDRARVQVARISRFGLLEMSRQRLRPSLGESSQHVCPRCKGQGTIRGIESLALSVLRIIEEEAMKESTARIVAQLPVDVAAFLLNEKRRKILEIEQRQQVGVVLVPNKHLETPDYSIERIRVQDVDRRSEDEPSYTLANVPEQELPAFASTKPEPKAEEPAVKGVTPAAPAPQRPTPARPTEAEPELDTEASAEAAQMHPENMLKKLWGMLFAPPQDATEAPGDGSAPARSPAPDATRQGAPADTPRQRKPRPPRRDGDTQQRRGKARDADDTSEATKAPAEEGRERPRRAQGGARAGEQGEQGERQRSSRRSGRGGRSRRGGQRDQAQAGGDDQQQNAPTAREPSSADEATAQAAHNGRDAGQHLMARADTLPMAVSGPDARRDRTQTRPEHRDDTAAKAPAEVRERSADTADSTSVGADAAAPPDALEQGGDEQGTGRPRTSRRRRGGRRRRSTGAGEATAETADGSADPRADGDRPAPAAGGTGVSEPAGTEPQQRPPRSPDAVQPPASPTTPGHGAPSPSDTVTERAPRSDTPAHVPASSAAEHEESKPTSAPELAASKPTSDAVAPEHAASKPVPDAVAPERAASKPVPDASAPEHAASKPVPDASAPEHTASKPVPDAVAPEHSASKPVPDASAPEHAASKPVPDVSAPEHAASKPVPDASADAPPAGRGQPSGADEAASGNPPRANGNTGAKRHEGDPAMAAPMPADTAPSHPPAPNLPTADTATAHGDQPASAERTGSG